MGNLSYRSILLSLWFTATVMLASLAQAAPIYCADVVSDSKQTTALFRQLKSENPRAIQYEDMDRVARTTLSYYKNNYAGRNIVIFTDASWDQKSGVITVMKILRDKIKELSGLNVVYVTPEDFKWHFNTGVQDVRIAYASKSEIKGFLTELDPAAIHIMVEGSVGFRVKKFLKDHNITFTSAYHTDFPKYAGDSIPNKSIGRFVMKLGYNILKGFHRDSQMIMAPTATMGQILVENGFPAEKIGNWSHGVEINRFDPSLRKEGLFEEVLQERIRNGSLKTARKHIEGPVSLFVGRIEKEKNLEDFLQMNVPGTKVLIGDGALRESLQEKYPDAVFLGKMNYESLPEFYASADLFVMTSLTETFGLVMLEAAAAGTPVLAYNVQGPTDVMTDAKAGILVQYEKGNTKDNIRRLEEGFQRALSLNREDVRQYAERHPWEHSIIEFLYFLSPIENNLIQRNVR